KREFRLADIVPMQQSGPSGRFEDAASVGRGVGRFGRAFARLNPAWVVVLGDRIEAFAAAACASIAGIPLAHLHGGDRAEGVADEAMRHAITKLAHLHLPATEASAERIVRMGERPETVRVVGSPAIDGLSDFAPMGDEAWRALGSPEAVFLMHPIGRSPEAEEASAAEVFGALRALGLRVLALEPNLDAGREGISRAIRESGVTSRTHLPRAEFVGLLKRMAEGGGVGGVLVGNSSAGLIEASALRLPVVDVGPRQAGRERPANVTHADDVTSVRGAIERALATPADVRATWSHPYGDGRAGERSAQELAAWLPRAGSLLRKRCAY
ncbi:MAG: UDP-N-acetylglucosamine 2-epimerase, partial [Planctomycetota bacterium]|nr:UDP-N-acetylglucosamine 2-epimerase [Planctomycetota bacterium]